MKTTTFFAAGFVVLSFASVRASDSLWRMQERFPRHQMLRARFVQAVRSGETAEMERICREGVELLPEDATWRYNLACSLAYYADKTEALNELERAIELGFDERKKIEADTDLKVLSGDPRFARLLEKADRHRAGARARGRVPPTVVAGHALTLTPSNTVWNFDAACYQSAVRILPHADGTNAPAYNGPCAEPLRAWLASGEAAGNDGDLYVNRDAGHSLLDVSRFPGLTPVLYEKAAHRALADVGPANTLFPAPVLGNSSTSLTEGAFWRSLPRSLVATPFRARLAMQFFLNNQCWVYPAHKDFTPEAGDLFPANLPFVTATKGSSFTDRPFLEAFAAASAAFRPEVKRALVARKRYAAALQVILRSTLKTVKSREAYYTGAAHPAVFDGRDLDPEAMVRMAHGMTADDLPAFAMIRMIRETSAKQGVDYFDPAGEALADTGLCVARVARNVSGEERMAVLAASAPGGPEAKFRWTVLQGDPAKIAIKPLDARASQVEIRVRDHGRFRPKGDDGLPCGYLTSRVDIGCFLDTASSKCPSLPAMYCVYFLPNESRVYRPDGKILSVDYTNPRHVYADPSLTLGKMWKDVYTYTDEGECTGWIRMFGEQKQHFTAEGRRILETDRQGRARKAVEVRYQPRRGGPGNLPPVLACEDGERQFVYTYKDERDRRGAAAPVP